MSIQTCKSELWRRHICLWTSIAYSIPRTCPGLYWWLRVLCISSYRYMGSYVSSPTGKLVFQEGVLVEAIRKGYVLLLMLLFMLALVPPPPLSLLLFSCDCYSLSLLLLRRRTL